MSLNKDSNYILVHLETIYHFPLSHSQKLYLHNQLI